MVHVMKWEVQVARNHMKTVALDMAFHVWEEAFDAAEYSSSFPVEEEAELPLWAYIEDLFQVYTFCRTKCIPYPTSQCVSPRHLDVTHLCMLNMQQYP